MKSVADFYSASHGHEAHQPQPKHRQRGISLIEAMLVVVVTAIVATTAAPSLAAFIDGSHHRRHGW